jgi:hypothetical protein
MYTLFRKLGIEGTKTFRYSGRAPNASSATGFSKVHIRQQQDLINEASVTN